MRPSNGTEHARPPTFAARALRLVVMAAEARGADVPALLAEAGLSPAELEDPDARVSLDVVRALYAGAARRTGDQDFGLHLGEQLPRGSMGLLDYVARTSATLGDAMRLTARYVRLVDQDAQLVLEEEGARTTVRHVLAGDPGGVPRHSAEFILCALLTSARQGTGVQLAPAEVRFMHPAPEDTSEHLRLFAAPVRFHAPDNALVLDSAHLRRPLLSADPELSALLERQARAQLEQLPAPVSISARLRHLLSPQLVGGEPDMARLAQQLHVSPRTLQRRLAEEGTRFRDVLDSLRRELALHHVKQGQLSLGEVGFLLGFQEPSAFHRAFRRWTGTTPSAWRLAPSAPPAGAPQARARAPSARSRK